MMIVARDVSVAYEKETILREVNLEIRPREFVVIVGPNGAGKTTLLTMINGLAQVRGKLRINGQEVHRSTLPSLRKGIAYVPQHWSVDPRTPLSVEDMILSGRCGQKGILSSYTRQDRQEAWELAVQLGIDQLWRRPIGQISGGEFQKATIARAIFQKPYLFLLDEPTASLDWQAGQELVKMIHDLHEERNLTTLMVTHELHLIPPFASRIMIMRNGAIIANGTPEQILKKDVFAKTLGWNPAF